MDKGWADVDALTLALFCTPGFDWCQSSVCLDNVNIVFWTRARKAHKGSKDFR